MYISQTFTDNKNEFGVNPAYLIDTLSYFTAKNKVNNANVIDGKCWVRFEGGYNKIAELIPILTPRQIGYAINQMVEQGILEVNNRLLNKFSSDKTYAYCLNDKTFETQIVADMARVKKKPQNSPTPNHEAPNTPIAQKTKTVQPAAEHNKIKTDMNKIDEDFIQLANRHQIDDKELLSIGQTAFNLHYSRRFKKSYETFNLTNYAIKGIIGKIEKKMIEENTLITPFNLLLKSEWYFWAAYRHKDLEANPLKFNPKYLNNESVFDSLYKKSNLYYEQNINPKNNKKRRIEFTAQYIKLKDKLENY